MTHPIFREKALTKLASPEQLDQLMRVTTPKAWLALLGLCCVVLLAVVWGLNGQVTSRIAGQGVLLAGDLNPVVTTEAGQVTEIEVAAGDVVQAGQVVARLAAAGATNSASRDVVSAYAGRVLAVAAATGDWVERGAVLLTLENIGQPWEAVVYVPLSEAKNVQPGMEVWLSPSTAPQELYGYLLGQVNTIAPLPVSAPALTRQLGNAALAQTFLQQGALIEVRVALKPDARAVTGYQWSSRGGPPTPLVTGTPCTAAIIVRRQRPISLIVPGLEP